MGQSASQIVSGNPMLLSAYWSGNAPLDYAWLATNETGAWENKTGIYSSPIKMSGYSGWSNFTWNNPSFSGITYWSICVNDTSGNINCTSIMDFQVVPVAPAPPGGQGGGAVLPIKNANFTLDREFLKISVKQGETILDHLKINNTGETALDFFLTVENMDKSVMLSENSFVLNLGESKTITVAFTAKEGTSPEIYTGRLMINAGNITKSVMLIMEVKPRKSLFDLYVSLPETPLAAVRGEEVEADILMYNFGEIRPVDVILYYSLRDFGGRDIILNHETIAVDEQKLVKRKVRIPADLEYGFYLFYARLEYSNQTATSSGMIKVAEEKAAGKAESYIDYWMIMAVSVAIGALILALVFWRMHTAVSSSAGGKKREAGEMSDRQKKIRENLENLRLMLNINSQMEEGSTNLKWVKKDIEKLKSTLKAFTNDRYFEKWVIIKRGMKKTAEISFRNEKEASKAALSVKGLPVRWYSVSPSSVYAEKGADAKFKVMFNIPENARSGVYQFNYVAKMGDHTITESASLVVTETEDEMLSKEFEMVNRKLSEAEEYYGMRR